jgi:predicted TIM-barrel fold metal-dependent hydrolase
MKVAMISCDSHAGPRPSDFATWLEPRYRDRIGELIAHMERIARQVWVASPDAESDKYVDTRGAIANGGLEGLSDPARRLSELEAEGFVAEVIFPGDVNSHAIYFSNMNECYPADYRAAGVRAYNRWLAEFCSYAPGRMLGVAQLEPWPDVGACVSEIEHVRKAGLRIIALPRFTGLEASQPSLMDSAWESVWRTCAAHDLIVSIHIGHQYRQGGSEKALETANLRANGFPDKGDDGVLQFDPARRLLWQIILSGVFDRYEDLKVTFTEIRTEWVAPMLAHLERRFDRHRFEQTGFAMPHLRPTDYWRRNCAVGGQLRPYEFRLRYQTGIDQMMFGTDYPHAEGTWPNTREWLRVSLRDVPEAEARKILGENAARIYAIDLCAFASHIERVGPEYSELCDDAPVSPALVNNLHWRAGFLGRPFVYSAEALDPLIDEDERLAATH